MKVKKLGTYPFGKIVAIPIIISSLILLVFAIVMLCQKARQTEIVIILIALTISILCDIYLLKTKYWNQIYVTETEIWSKKEKFNWSEVYITACARRIPSTRHDAYYFYFASKYLKKDETKATRKNDFYMLLTKERAAFILSLYNKKVEVLEKSLNLKKMLDIIEAHNQKYNIKQNESAIVQNS